jgi:hypothetical protein
MALAATTRMQGSKRAVNRRARDRAALLLIDFMNPMDFDGAQAMAPRAVKAAARAPPCSGRACARTARR